ncbi:hypothetical protein BYT27DRAFT_7158386 [Phlegmacium glaucopus]|nr:hypothetical protein BYT27DRAFT_7158386 [Phlegmacium glaucopus]
MSNERPSKNNRMQKVTRSFRGKLSSLLHLSRSPTTSSIDVVSSSDNHTTATTDAGTSDLPFNIVPVAGVDHAPVASMKAYTVPPPIPVPVSATAAGVPRQPVSVSSAGPEHETPPTMSPNTHSSMSLLQGAHNVYMSHPTITMANNIQNVFSAGGNERTRPQILAALRENLLPRAERAEYDAASPAPRNACTANTRRAILDTLQVWASDKTTTKVYWLNGMAGTGKTTIAYSFSKILDEKNSLSGTFFSSHLQVDLSDVYCIIPTICLQLAASGYLPSLSHLILNVVEANPDCKSWRIGKQFLNFLVRPLTAAYRDTSEVVVVPVIVLDALDECSDQSLVAELLAAILEHSTSLPVKFFVTSRPEIRLKESFGKSWTYSNC